MAINRKALYEVHFVFDSWVKKHGLDKEVAIEIFRELAHCPADERFRDSMRMVVEAYEDKDGEMARQDKL